MSEHDAVADSTSDAEWISTREFNGIPIVDGDQLLPNGNYFFERSFALSKTGSERFFIDGTFYLGKSVLISATLNGTEVVGCCPGLNPDTGSSFNSTAQVIFVDDQFLFLDGPNTLTFFLQNGPHNNGGFSKLGFGFLGHVQTQPIPEPASYLLLGMALAALSVARRGRFARGCSVESGTEQSTA